MGIRRETVEISGFQTELGAVLVFALLTRSVVQEHMKKATGHKPDTGKCQ